MKRAYVNVSNVSETIPWRKMLNSSSFPFGLCAKSSDGHHICLICNKTFGLGKNAFKHVRSSHSDLKEAPGGAIDADHTGQYLCDCGIGLKTKSKLQYHKMTVHQKRMQYACPQCSTPFMYKSTADRHIITCEGNPNEASKTLKATAIKHPPIEPSFALFALLQDITTRLTIDIATGIQQSKLDPHFADFLSQGEEQTLKGVLRDNSESKFFLEAHHMALVVGDERDLTLVNALEKFLKPFVAAIKSKNITFESIKRYSGDGFQGTQWGSAVFAKKLILEGSVITELVGHLRAIPKKNGNVNEYSVIILDGRKDKLLTGPASFINHHCTEYNVAYNLLEGQQTLNVRALRDIEKGEELFVNYGPLYFSKSQCQCSFCLRIDIDTMCKNILNKIIDDI